jgi:hypothetical protein
MDLILGSKSLKCEYASSPSGEDHQKSTKQIPYRHQAVESPQETFQIPKDTDMNLTFLVPLETDDILTSMSYSSFPHSGNNMKGSMLIPSLSRISLCFLVSKQQFLKASVRHRRGRSLEENQTIHTSLWRYIRLVG